MHPDFGLIVTVHGFPVFLEGSPAFFRPPWNLANSGRAPLLASVSAIHSEAALNDRANRRQGEYTSVVAERLIKHVVPAGRQMPRPMYPDEKISVVAKLCRGRMQGKRVLEDL